jgi:heme-degrading monooxygenase HmoA
MPYLRLTWGKLRLGAWDQYESMHKKTVEPTVKTIKGLQMRELLRSTEDPDEGISVTLWETEEDMNNYEGSELHQSIAKESEPLYRGEYWVKKFYYDPDKLLRS